VFTVTTIYLLLYMVFVYLCYSPFLVQLSLVIVFIVGKEMYMQLYFI